MAFQWIMSGCLAQTREGLGYHVQEEGEECCCWSRANVGAWGRTGCVCYEWNVVVSSLKVRLSFFSCSVVSNSLWPHEQQHARLPCSSPSPGAFSNSCWLSQWCHPTISSSVAPFSSCPQFFPASGSFPVSQLFTSGGQSIGASTSASVLPMNIQGWFPLGLTGLILQSKELSRVFSSTTVTKNQIFDA